jgi:hypothetical protein
LRKADPEMPDGFYARLLTTGVRCLQ